MSVTADDFSTWPDFSKLLAGAENGDEAAGFHLLQKGMEGGLFPRELRHGSRDLPEDIPRHIVQYWHDPAPPDDVAAIMAGVQQNHPDFSYERYCDESARDFIQNYYGSGIRSVYDHCPHPAMRSDFWRICYLHEKGGIYVDADMACLHHLTSITRGLNAATLLAFSIGETWCVDNDLLITRAGTPLIRALLEETVQRSYHALMTGNFENIWVVSGPGAMVAGSMKWAARTLREHYGSDIPPAHLLAEAGLMFIPHPVVEEALRIQKHLSYQQTEANWRNFSYDPTKRHGEDQATGP